MEPATHVLINPLRSDVLCSVRTTAAEDCTPVTDGSREQGRTSQKSSKEPARVYAEEFTRQRKEGRKEGKEEVRKKGRKEGREGKGASQSHTLNGQSCGL